MSPDELTPIKPNYRGEASQLGKMRPDRPPQTQKSFQKLVRKDKPDVDEDEVTEVDESDLPPTTSLFDLSAKKLKAKPPAFPSFSGTPVAKKLPIFDEGEETQIAAFPEDEQTVGEQVSAFARQVNRSPKEIPDTDTELSQLPVTDPKIVQKSPEKPITDPLLSELAANEAKPIPKPNISKKADDDDSSISEDKTKLGREVLDTDATVLASKKEKTKLTVREKNDFSGENPDISAVNPQVPQHAPISSPVHMVEEPKTPPNVNAIVEQMVKALQVVEREGKTDTVVTLQYPPLFEGATITLSTLEGGGKREFNLSFANLQNDAKIFLDRKIIENSLIETLARNDITIHMLKTSTLPESTLNMTPEAQKYFAREEREQQRNQQWENPEEQEN